MDNVSWEDKIEKELEIIRQKLDLACIDTEESICIVSHKLQNYQQLKARVSAVEQRIKQAPADSTTKNNVGVRSKQKTGKYVKNGKPIHFGDL
eukprot:3973888-Ditylum_brightwellii.AAC.1